MGIEFMLNYWPLFAAGASVIVWVVRIEAKAASNTREIERLWEQRKEDLTATNKKLDDMAMDIKTLLQRSGR